MLRKHAFGTAFAVCVSLFILTGADAADAPQEINVSAALSLKNAFEEMAKAYAEQKTGVKVIFNFGASGDLIAQIKGGAPVDVFASAAAKDMDDLDKGGFVLSGTKVNFTSNTVVMIVPAASKSRIASFEALAGPDVEKIAVGNPVTAPIGRYADEVFQYMKIAGAIKGKLIFAENVRQILDYVARGEVDAGVVYATDALTRPKEVKVMTTAPEGSHRPVVYPIAVVKGSKQEEAAREFIRFVTSAEGIKVLERYGFRSKP